MPESGLPIRVYNEHDVSHVDYEGETEDHTSREEARPQPTRSLRPKSAPWSPGNDDLVAVFASTRGVEPTGTDAQIT